MDERLVRGVVGHVAWCSGIATFCGFVQPINEEGHVLVVCSVVVFWFEEAGDSELLEFFLVDEVGHLME